MQTLNAMVALSGDRNNMLWKTKMTPAEVLLLQQLHGDTSVSQIEPEGEVQREPVRELERLKYLYPQHVERVQNVWRDHPGELFPMTIDQLGLNPALLKPAEAAAPFTVSAKRA